MAITVCKLRDRIILRSSKHPYDLELYNGGLFRMRRSQSFNTVYVKWPKENEALSILSFGVFLQKSDELIDRGSWIYYRRLLKDLKDFKITFIINGLYCSDL